ncbi:MAG: hypothetical protein IJS10_03375 [Alphaproteobacteria bacterium]|nr:hypothetical protein [Alphaproteobacteria bacterium]
MSKITCIFKNSESATAGIEAQKVTNIYLLEAEGEYPKAVIRLHHSEYKSLNQLEFCDILRDGVLFFKGKVCSIALTHEFMEIELTTDIRGDFCPEKIRREFADIVEKFKEENPDLFTKISTEEFLRTGEKVLSDIKSPTTQPVEIDEHIVDGTLKFERAVDAPLTEVNLRLSAAWISRRDGLIPISTKIEKRFKMSRINTLTPKKLENSWPEFGDRIRSKNNCSEKTTPTKYTIASSRLRKMSMQDFPAIVIDKSIPKIYLRKHIYENRLLLSWDFEQYMYESICVNIFAHKSGYKGACKTLNINLKNVQEYVENANDTSFFRNKNGNAILNSIVKSVADFLISSWRNIEISCELIENETTGNLSTKDWIKLRNKSYKIVKIEREFDSNKRTLKLKARAFSYDFRNNEDTINIALPDEKPQVIIPEDVIADIAVSNEADTQYNKLLQFISEQKRENKINKDNYKTLINNFLNEHQTKIQIETKPLKIAHCEKKIIEAMNIYLNGGVK